MADRYGLEIRAASLADAPGLAELFTACGLPATPRALAERLERMGGEPGVVLIASDWGPPSGLIAAGWRRTLEADAPLAVVSTLLVAPDDRRRGLGRLLLKAASQAARQAGCAELSLAAPQEAGALVAFCRATGFEEVGGVWGRGLRKRRG